MKCLILAAGNGNRIADKGDSKPLIPVMGLPLIERTIATAQQAGITDFCVVTGHNAEKVEDFLTDLSQRRRVKITAIKNHEWEKGNGSSLLTARDRMGQRFLLLMADHVIDEQILRSLTLEELPDDGMILVADFAVGSNGLVDHDDVTKVLADDHKIVEIGKRIETYNAYDTGVFLCSPAIFTAMDESAKAGDESLSGGVRRLAAQGKAKTVDVADRYWVDVDTASDLKKAERVLRDTLVKPNDGFVARNLNRKISTRIVTPLLLKISNRITANQVSILSFGVSLFASLSFFVGFALAGGLLIQLASILDGSDGEVARLRKTQSPFGNFFDAVLDRYSDSFILFGMFYFSLMAGPNRDLFGQYWTPLILVTSMLAIFGNTMVSYTSAKSETDFGYRYAGRWIAAGTGRDLRLFVLFIGGVTAWIHPISMFVAIAAVALITNGIVLRRMSISRSYWEKPNPLANGRLKAVIFDFDGTIADTMPFLSGLAVNLITTTYGVSDEVALAKYRETTGMEFRMQIEKMFPGDPRNRDVVDTFEQRKLERILDHPVFAEVVPALEHLRNRQVKRFICSSTSERTVLEYSKNAGIDGLFDACFGSRTNFSKRHQIDYVLDHHGLEAEEVLFVSDSVMDYEFVRESGVRFAGIQRMFDEREFDELGLFSVQDLTALTNLWSQAPSLIYAPSHA